MSKEKSDDNGSPKENRSIVYSIIRVDYPIDIENADYCIKVVKVMDRKEDAEKEVERLNEINGKKGCRYHLDMCKYFKRSQS